MAAASVLICEDSGTYAAALRRTLEYDGDISVISICGSAEEAVAAIRILRPDLITMDIELPGMDGLAAVELIMGTRPMPIMVLSSHVGPGSDKAAAALGAGALDAVAKDDLDLSRPASLAGAAFRHRIRVISHASVIRHPRARLTPQVTVPGLPRVASAVGICSSAGGPPVLAQLLGGLPAGYQVPILVVQHISNGFTESLARWLDQKSPLPVRVPEDGQAAGPGAWIAPEGGHLVLGAGGLLSVDRTTIVGYHRPSGDILLTSIATAAGRRGVAVVLTGMGNDGAEGTAAVHAAGGLAIAQDEASSAIYGMPKAAYERGADMTLPPEEIIETLAALHYQPLGGSR
ncbi:MAG TPA: chemotaxis protein CheB [Streptosporangiaceae bacterium]|nr:chemotaxis protein CheB [Streptosporangiaceae bacterium]